MKNNPLFDLNEKKPKIELNEAKKIVDKQELNLWKRGFTPQAEIWN